jgi:serine/threonine protein kinase
MNDKNSGGWAEIINGSIFASGKLLELPNFKAIGEIGRGANAVIFEAIDEFLGRKVAVKIWNSRGKQRAQLETAKIAKLNHPLVVNTYFFGLVDGHPYCVMELVPGMSGKEWIKGGHSIEDRALIWELYSKALKFVHENEVIHGDPHLGNLLIFPEVNDLYSRNSRWPYAHSGWGAKIADAGTSEFWTSDEKFLEREAQLIFETANRLFYDQKINKLWPMKLNLNHRAMLEALDVLCEYVLKVNTWIDWDRRSENADQLVDMVMKVPVFEINEVMLKISETGYTNPSRFARRLNAYFSKASRFLDVPDTLEVETLEKYRQLQRKYLNENNKEVIREKDR